MWLCGWLAGCQCNVLNASVPAAALCAVRGACPWMQLKDCFSVLVQSSQAPDSLQQMPSGVNQSAAAQAVLQHGLAF